jgi:hypothetical protein
LIGVRESKRKDPTFANNILLGGLSVQVFSFFIYVFLFAAFIWRARDILFFRKRQAGRTARDSTVSQPDAEKVDLSSESRTTRPVSLGFLATLSIATLAVYLRTCYRLSETAQYNYGSRAHNVKEGYFGGLEFAPIVICVYLLAIWHPGRYLALQSPAS